MALQESFELSDGTGFATWGTSWRMQSWTTTSAYTITDVALYCYKYTSPGDITVSIRAVDGDGKPTGVDLATITVADSVISTFPTRAWYTFTFSSPYALDDATQYAIVWRAPNGDAGNYFAPFGYGSSGYADGGTSTGTSSGTSWSTVNTNNDADFRIYGGTPVPGKPTIVSPTPTGVTGITLDETPLEWAAGDPAGDTYEIYWRIQGDSWVLVGVAQAGIEWTIDFGTLGYGTTYEWRIDATNTYGTTTGDTWSFGSISFDPVLPSGVTLDSNGNPTGTPTGLNFMTAIRKLVVAANNKIWIEDI